MNSPPDIVAWREADGDGGRRRGPKPLHEHLKKDTRLFVCGLALDFCVFDTCMNACALGFESVYIVLDAARAAHIPGVGQFGTGFLSNPGEFLDKLGKAGVKVTFTVNVMGGAGLVSEPNKKAAAANFPNELSPLAFQDVEMRGKKQVPMALKGEGQYEVSMVGDLTELKSLGWDNTGKCSPKAPVPVGWPGAPAEAKTLCWAYPIADSPQPKQSANNMFGFLSLSKSSELCFALRGGFLLLSETGEVLKAQLVVPGAGHSLTFGEGAPLSQEAEEQLKESRMQVVTLPHLRKAGATHFCWVNPEETFGAFRAPALGAFAYLLQDKGPVFFAVKGSRVISA